MYALVIVEHKVKSLDKEFVYLIPTYLRGKIKAGMCVLVPFGKQEVAGFVLKTMEKYEEDYPLKEIKDIISELTLSEELIAVGKHLKELTLCSSIVAFQTMLPSSLKIKKRNSDYNLYDEYIYLKNEAAAIQYMEMNKNRKAQNKVIEKLLQNKEILKKSVNANICKALKENDIIGINKVHKYRINKEGNNLLKELTKEQQKVYESVNLNTYNTYLLYGVTGSGKTEIYIHLINQVINMGRTAILLVPEISLTTQIAKRFYEAFGSDVAILNSSLSDGERYDEYLKIYRGEVKVVVGTRSAVFAPFKNLGIIIMDEEDASSYKQDNNPRYHARDIASFRAKYNNIPLVLGSATPSLESMARALKNVYKLLVLNKRVNNKLPVISLVDMKEEIKNRNLLLSEKLKKEIKNRLDRKEQVILFLNRRGFSTFINCSNCGYVFKCPSCDISLTYHKSNNSLICHYCGFYKHLVNKCPKCLMNSLNFYGLGTEKLEEVLKQEFKNARVIRMDQDTTKNKGAHEKIISSFYEGEYDILVGTQMISKGLDFPNVTLVGVINADTSLSIPDYKASENTFSLLSQIAGRSGRGEKSGEVIIQTFNPDNYVINYVKNNDYASFYKQEMNFRHKLNYPPYYFLIGIRVIGYDYNVVSYESKNAVKYLKDNLSSKVYVLGPAALNVLKFNNEYRMQIIIKYQKEDNIMEVLKALDKKYVNNKKMHIEIDVNPIKI